MRKVDNRSLKAEVKEDIRQRAVLAVLEGRKVAEVASFLGVARQSVNRWLRDFREKGKKGLKTKAQGRPKVPSKLLPWQIAQIVNAIEHYCPDQLKLPFALWTREAVTQLIDQRFQIKLSRWTMGRLLKKWGFTPQKPTRRAYEQNLKAVENWLQVEYPAIRERARTEKAVIYWGDEMGLRSDHQAGTSYGKRGKTPVVRNSGKRFSCNMISVLTNKGELAFMVFEGKFNSPVFLRFLKRLLKHQSRKVFLILDGHPVHCSKLVKDWLQASINQIEVFFLPGYSPELNPTELLNQDVKANAFKIKRPRNKKELKSSLGSYMHSIQRQPQKVKNYFKSRFVQYASA
jgi:transposase